MSRRELADFGDDLQEPRFGRRVLVFLGILTAILTALYFGLSSNAFLQAVVLPRLTSGINGTVTVGHIGWNPFSGFLLREVAVRGSEGETVFGAASVAVRYRPWSVLGCDWQVTDLRLESPRIEVVQGPERASSWKRLWDFPADQGPPPPAYRPLTWQVDRLVVKDGQAAYQRVRADGTRTVVEIQGLQLSTEPSADEKEGVQWVVESGLRLSDWNPRDEAAPEGLLAMTCRGELSCQLSRRAMPIRFDGDFRLSNTEATGSWASLDGLAIEVRGRLADTILRDCEVRFERLGESLGGVELLGVIEPDSLDLRVESTLTAVDPRILNLLGRPLGVGFGETTLSGRALLDLSQNGEVVNINSSLRAQQFALELPTGTTPALDVDFDCDIRTELDANSANIKDFVLVARQGTNEVLRIADWRTINLDWTRLNPRPDTTEAELEVSLTGVNLAEWRPLFGSKLPDGIVHFTGLAHNRDAGRRLRFDFTNRVEQLAFAFDGWAVSNAVAEVKGEIAMKDYLGLGVDELELKAWLDGIPLLDTWGSGSFEWRNHELRFESTTEAALTNLVAHFPHPWIDVHDGSLRVESAVRWEDLAKTATLRMLSSGLEGRLGDFRFEDHDLQAECIVDWTSDMIFLRSLGLACGKRLAELGSLYLGGRVGRSTREGDFSLQLVNLTSSALTPFLTPYLPDVRIVDGTIDGKGTFTLNAAGPNPFEFTLKTENLALESAGSGWHHYPLTLSATLSGVQRDWRIEMVTNTIALPRTQETENTLTFDAELDFSPTNRAPSRIELRSYALDLTPALDHYRGLVNVADLAATAGGQMAAGGEETHPAPLLSLPGIAGLQGEVSVKNLRMRELAISDVQGRLRLDGESLGLEEWEMQVFGRPLRFTGERAQRDGRFGWQWKATAEGLPLAPLTTSLLDSPPGRYIGEVYLDLSLDSIRPAAAGASGHLNLGLTNLNFRVLPGWTRQLLAPLASGLGADELLDPAISYLGGRATQHGESWSVQDLALVTDSLLMQASGAVQPAPVLADTPLTLPVKLALGEALARRLGLPALVQASRPGYVQLPAFATITGTLAHPTNRVDAAALDALLAGARPERGGAAPNETSALSPAAAADPTLSDADAGEVLPFRPDLLAPPSARGATNVPPE